MCVYVCMCLSLCHDCVCVYVCRHTCATTHEQRSEENLRCQSLPFTLRQSSSHSSMYRPGWLESFHGSPMLELQIHSPTSDFMWFWDPNSVPHTCMESLYLLSHTYLSSTQHCILEETFGKFKLC